MRTFLLFVIALTLMFGCSDVLGGPVPLNMFYHRKMLVNNWTRQRREVGDYAKKFFEDANYSQEFIKLGQLYFTLAIVAAAYLIFSILLFMTTCFCCRVKKPSTSSSLYCTHEMVIHERRKEYTSGARESASKMREKPFNKRSRNDLKMQRLPDRPLTAPAQMGRAPPTEIVVKVVTEPSRPEPIIMMPPPLAEAPVSPTRMPAAIALVPRNEHLPSSRRSRRSGSTARTITINTSRSRGSESGSSSDSMTISIGSYTGSGSSSGSYSGSSSASTTSSTWSDSGSYSTSSRSGASTSGGSSNSRSGRNSSRTSSGRTRSSFSRNHSSRSSSRH